MLCFFHLLYSFFDVTTCILTILREIDDDDETVIHSTTVVPEFLF